MRRSVASLNHRHIVILEDTNHPFPTAYFLVQSLLTSFLLFY
jgi:hypothetical protein